MTTASLPRIALTLGDVAGIGPEIIARSLAQSPLREWCHPLVTGHPEVLRRAFRLVNASADIKDLSCVTQFDPESRSIQCWNPGNDDAAAVDPGELDARAGAAAYSALVAATHAALDGHLDGITTAPLNKEALHLAGHDYPGHTEILAKECGVERFAMMLYLPESPHLKGEHGLSITHVTLHTSIQSVPHLLTTPKVQEKIVLQHRFLQDIGCETPRVAVCALNPHGGENGLFGDEESRVIQPAVEQAQLEGIRVTGPLPADTLIRRAVGGEFDGIVAMYHDQGHIAIKLIGFDQAVNVTLGLPIVRTSPSHGTAFEIAGQGRAEASGFQQAVRTAALLAQRRQRSMVNPS